MPDHLKALVVVLLLACTVFVLAKSSACALASDERDYERRRNLWLGLTLTAFLAQDFWIYVCIAGALLFIAASKQANKPAMYFFILFALPPVAAEIPSPGIVENLFAVNYLRLLALAVLLPAFLSLRKQADREPFGRTLPDKLLAAYLVLSFVLQLTSNTLTYTLRHYVFYAFIEVFLPYYVVSRSLRSLADFRDALMAFVVAALVLSAIGTFEFLRHWLLYANLDEALGVRWGLGGYASSGRGDSLRAVASTGQPIVLGYVIAVALAFHLFLRRCVPNVALWTLGVLALLAGLVAPLSRGPWIGAALAYLVFVATGPSAVLRLARLALLGMFAIPLLLVTPAGEAMLDYLPFIGSIDRHNVTYRQLVLEVGVQVIMQNPFFGSRDFIFLPEMQALRQGEGIVDLVNTYLVVGLWTGLVGLTLFTGFFAIIAVGLWNGLRRLPDKGAEAHLLGQALLSALLGIVVMISSSASISFVPVVYWSVAGLGVAYLRMVKHVRGVAEPDAVGAWSGPVKRRA
jgi:O-antigen ligase